MLFRSAAIGAAIVADRQYDPISVAQLPGSDRFILVDGLHRLEGLRQRDVALIDSRIVPADRAMRRTQEVASAWARADHDVFDRAAQMAELAAMARNEDPFQSIGTALRWDLATAEALGVKKSTVRNYINVGMAYDAEDKALLRKRCMADDLVPLLRLAALPPDEFHNAMTLIETGDATSITEAMTLIAGGAPIDPIAKKNSAFFNHFTKRPLSARADFIQQLLGAYHIDGREKARGR